MGGTIKQTSTYALALFQNGLFSTRSMGATKTIAECDQMLEIKN